MLRITPLFEALRIACSSSTTLTRNVAEAMMPFQSIMNMRYVDLLSFYIALTIFIEDSNDEALSPAPFTVRFPTLRTLP